MIEYEDFIYLDVYRTGSSHIIGLLQQVSLGPPVKIFRHAALTKAHPLGLTRKTVFTSVRNPWDWYVSLWAYGSDGKSAIRRYLAGHFKPKDLAALYDKADAVNSFQRWLAVMHDKAMLARVMKEHLPESGLAPVLGLYSYRFLRVTTRFPRLLLRRPFIRAASQARSYHRFLKVHATVLRNETLSADFAAFVETHPAGFRADAAAIIRAADIRPANASGRTLGGYRAYYRDSDAALVAARDRFFIDEFGYGF